MIVRKGPYTDAERLEDAKVDELAHSDLIVTHWTEPVVGELYGNRVVINVEIDSGEVVGIDSVVWDDGHEERFTPEDGDWQALVAIVTENLPQYPWA